MFPTQPKWGVFGRILGVCRPAKSLIYSGPYCWFEVGLPVNPLVGGSNPSRGAQISSGRTRVTPTAFPDSLALIRTADRKQDGSTTPRSGGDRPQGDPKGEAQSAESSVHEPVKTITYDAFMRTYYAIFAHAADRSFVTSDPIKAATDRYQAIYTRAVTHLWCEIGNADARSRWVPISSPALSFGPV